MEVYFSTQGFQYEVPSSGIVSVDAQSLQVYIYIYAGSKVRNETTRQAITFKFFQGTQN